MSNIKLELAMKYETLKHLYYSNQTDYESTYRERYNSEYTHHLDFDVSGNKAFFVVTPGIQRRMLNIQRTDKKVFSLCQLLPPKAIDQFTLRCLIDELVLTNSIEGVNSTRREIYDIIDGLDNNEKARRFKGLVQKYIMLQQGGLSRIETCQDVRKIYDELALPEVVESEPDNAPDGEIFRKGSVSVHSNTQKEIHRGLYPESKIISAMESALKYLNDDSEELLYRTAVFHYMLGYIHPFYDGNGRLNRFISSYMITNELESVLSYRLSYTIKQNINKYYEAFKICNSPQNKGDLTPFVDMFLEIIEESIVSLLEALGKRYNLRRKYSEQIACLPYANDETCYSLYDVLIQAELFSEHGISTRELLMHLGKSRETLRKKLSIVKEAGLLKVEKIKKEKYYGIKLDVLDGFIEWRAAHKNQE